MTKLLPFFTYLQISQLEYYQIPRLLSWWFQNPLRLHIPQIVPLKPTAKAKLLTVFYFAQYLLLCLLFLGSSIPLYLFLFCLLLLLFTPLGLIVSQLLLFPIEYIQKAHLIYQSTSLLSQNQELITIAITGSFGKTTTKDFLFQILDSAAPSLKTTHSYNTPLGLAATLRLGLTKHTRYFIAEFGAHRPQDINQLVSYYPPDYAIITAIGPQHLDRFGSIDQIITAKFQIAQNLNPNHLLLNLDNPHIQSHIKSHPQYLSSPTFSLNNPRADFHLNNYRFDPQGVSFVLSYKNKSYPFTAPIFGTSNLSNLLAAISQAFLLNIPYSTIKQALAVLTPALHRLELIPQGQSTLIDNTYSSNLAGFNQIIDDLKALPGPKALITPGLVELGASTAASHQQLGQKSASVFKTIVLIGRNPRTKNFEIGLKKGKSKAKVFYLLDHRDYWPTVNKLSQNHSWILLENDLPQNY